MEKIGRNKPCPCGSGKKFKRCHGDPVRQGRVRVLRPDEIPPEVLRAIADQQRQETERIRRFGQGRPMVTLDHQGHRVVAVGSTLHVSKEWKTFHDFLMHYIKKTMGEDWGTAEIKTKPFEERHPLIQWYYHVCMFQKSFIKEPGKVHSATATAPARAYMALAYDLYTLRHHGLLQEKLIARLKVKEQFQGARYETYVTAAFIRAGFEIALENEDDGTITHCEFVATHQATGLKYSVEAKSRHRPGLLGQPGTPQPVDQKEREVMRLLRRALQKNADHPRIVFIDVNMPPHAGSPFEAPWFHSIARRLRKLEGKHQKKDSLPPAFLFFTNHPQHYVGTEEPEPGQVAIFTAIGIPDFGQDDPTIIPMRFPALDHLAGSVFNHTEIPHEFPDSPLGDAR